MTSLISWLDASTEENSKMRELVKLFGTPETTDDLGMGQLRDAISNSLFPGTSVLHLGARYMLLVPWAYQTAHRSTKNPEDLRKRSEESERQLIGRLKEIGEDSYIGRDAGRNVRQLPSAAYWSALRRYGIVNPDADRSAVAQLMCTDSSSPEDGENNDSVWNQTLPKPPARFPQTEERGLTLTHDEARWLQERILTTCPGTMLAHVVGSEVSPTPGLWAPWLDPSCRSAEGEPAQWLNDAESFSFIHNGATILYQHLLAERSASVFNAGEDTLESTQELLESWEDQRDSKRELLAGWDMNGYLDRAKALNPGINSNTADFARAMAEAALSPSKLIDNAEFRAAVEIREKLMKKSNSRFRNERRLRAWQPPAQVASLSFRWAQVRRNVLDIHAGLALEGQSHA
ncbi:hypothetical protein J2X01_002874 [Arthrobacter ginsengisoli]|uniref:Uncharacterized protein n=1 Tax=Arthrobacter ginsengisoli TaxID=1356565 RepID=A0ABU1UEF4_9MICC|nr:DUF6361 family protein [Arthrobacter ginsengisoli]MDR7083579.1 hypothetical protein [Arthrobacter ginsengisoli]